MEETMMKTLFFATAIGCALAGGCKGEHKALTEAAASRQCAP